MAAGKPIKKSFYTESESATKNIEMPPMDMQSAAQEEESQNNSSFGVVPDSVPKEVYDTMNNEETNSTQENQEEVESSQEVSQESEETNESSQQEEKKQDYKPSASESFKAVREAKEKAERERDTLMYKMLEIQQQQQAYQQKQAPPMPEEPDDNIDFNIQEDDIVEGRYVKKVTNRIKNLEKQLKEYESSYKQTNVENKIKQELPDFDAVVSPENVDLLNRQFPEIAQSLRDTPDFYNKAVSVYNVMKKFGIHRDNPHEQDRIQAMKNTQKPRTVTSVSPQQGDSALSKANIFAQGLTEDLKDRLRKEMLAARKSI